MLGLLLSGWTIASSGPRSKISGTLPNDYFNLLADGFLAGHLSLPLAVPGELALFSDPYDPAANQACCQPQDHDLAYYEGRFYLTWGPTAVLVLFIPWRVLHVGDLAEDGALFILSAVSLASLLAMLGFLAGQFAPKARRWQLLLAAVAITCCDVVPFIDRTPDG